MTFSAEDIIARLWNLANTDPSQTNGESGGQRDAFKTLVDIHGGVGFIACQPVAELVELARRGVCSADLYTTLRELARVELQRRRLLIELADLEVKRRRLKGAAAKPSNVLTAVTKAPRPTFQ